MAKIGFVIVFLFISLIGIVSFSPDVFAADAWCNLSTCDSDWSFRKKITIDNTKVSGTSHTDFAVLISLSSDTDLNSSNVQSAGEDIRFTNEDGSAVLSYEIESFSNDGTDGTLVAWVEIPTLSGTADTVLYMYYGNSGASSTANAANVWDSNYVAVYHMNQTTFGADTTLDSTSNNNDGSPGGNPVAESSGQIDGAVDFDSNDQISIDDDASLDITGTITLEAWVKTSTGGLYPMLISKGTTNTAYLLFADTDNAGKATFRLIDPGFQQVQATTTINDGVFYHVVGTYDGTNVRIYVDGALEATNNVGSITIDTNNNPLFLGSSSNTLFIGGILDEIRISNIGRSSDFITTEYNNQNSPGTFYSVSTQDQLSSLDVATVRATGSSSITIQKLNSNPEASSPSGVIVGSFFDITESGALSDRTVILSYSDADIAGLVESSLTINRFSGGAWTALTTTVDTSANTATATAPGFSSFVLSGTRASTGSVDNIKPSFITAFAENEYPITIDGTTFKMPDLAGKVDTITVETGKPIQVKVLVFDETHASEIWNVNLLTNLRGGLRQASDSDTGIYFQSGNPPTVIDPNGYFANIDATSSEKGNKLEVIFDITFAKEMDTSDIIITAKDRGNNAASLQVIEAWKAIKSVTVEEPVVEEEEPLVVLTEEADFTSLTADKTLYRKNDKIIFSGTITNSDEIVTITIHDPNGKFVKLVTGLPDADGNFQTQVDTEFYFNLDGTYTAIAFTSDKNKVTTIPFKFLTASLVEPKDSEKVSSIISQEIVVPSWLKNSAGWWSNDLIRDDEFVKGIQYLINEDILKIPETEQTGIGSTLEIPSWIKNNAGWWADDLLTDYDFVQGIQWLIANGIMKV